MSKSDSLDKAEARKHLTQILHSGGLVISVHAKKEMRERNFDVNDVNYIIEQGKIRGVSFDHEHDNWKIEVEGADLEGDGLTLHLGLDIENAKIILVTGHSSRHRRL